MFVVLCFVTKVNHNLSLYRTNSIKEHKERIWKVFVVPLATAKATAEYNSYSEVRMFHLHEFPLMQFLLFF